MQGITQNAGFANLLFSAPFSPQLSANHATIGHKQVSHSVFVVFARDITQMSNQNGQNGTGPQETPQGITKITVGGYKSIAQEQSIEIRPLTILAGANSSGKSSIMQPLLLLKQTLEAPYDPGALLLNGPHIKYTEAEQLFSRNLQSEIKNFHVSIEATESLSLSAYFEKKPGRHLDVKKTEYGKNGKLSVFKLGMSSKDIEATETIKGLPPYPKQAFGALAEYTVIRNRCFLLPQAIPQEGATITFLIGAQVHLLILIQNLLHVPGLRGNPERSYPVAAVGEQFPGSFESYAASVITHWQSSKDVTKMAALQDAAIHLGLTNSVVAKSINDTQVELRVGRTLHSDASDTVSIADVGIGVSQTLPVLVALLAAKPGQLVYLEQPEIHLHPRAQTAMAQVLADAAMRGVRVVAETHSSLLLLGIQTLVAEGKLPPELVKLHWFERGDDGATTIRSADLDEGGRFGDWPEDFGDVSLDAQYRFLDAAERHLLKR
jgi:predicted ATPase